MSSQCRIELFGGLRIRVGSHVITRLPTHKAGLLLAVLTLNIGRKIPRKDLAALIWPDVDGSSALTSLRQALAALRRIPEVPVDLVEADRNDLRIRPEGATSDFAEFEEAINRAGDPSFKSSECELLQTAVDLYSGELLSDYQEYWIEPYRTKARGLFQTAISRLIAMLEVSGNLPSAIVYARKALRIDPLREESCLLLMRLYAATGDKKAALTQFRDFESRLRRDLGEAPSEDAVRYADGLRRANRKRIQGVANSTSPARWGAWDENATSPVVLDVVSNGVGPRRSGARIVAVGLALLVFVISVGVVALQSRNKEANSRSVISQPHTEAVMHSGTVRTGNLSPRIAEPTKSVALTSSKSGGVSGVHRPAPVLVGSSQPVVPAAGSNPPVSRIQPTPHAPVQWVARYHPQPGDKTSEGTAVALDAGLNVYVTGFVDTQAHDVDFLTVKYNPNGKLEWEKRYNGPGNDVDRARGIAVDDDGNVYVTGESDNGNGNQATHLCGTDFATIKYDRSGNRVWLQRYNGPSDGEDRPIRLLLDRSAIYVLGTSWGNDAGKPGFEYALVKYSRDGTLLWSYRYGAGFGDDQPADMALDRDGNVLITGASRIEPASGPELDMLTIKVSAGGKKMWEHRYGADNGADDKPCAIGLDGGNNVYVVGEGRGAPGSADGVRSGCITVKYDDKGRLIWVRGTTAESNHLDNVLTAQVGSGGNVAACGLAGDVQGNTVCRILFRDRSGQTIQAWDACQVAGEDGPSAVSIIPKGAILCGGLRRTGADVGFAVLQYKNGRPAWQDWEGSASGKSRARAIATNQQSLIVVGQTSEGGAAHMFVVRYKP